MVFKYKTIATFNKSMNAKSIDTMSENLAKFQGRAFSLGHDNSRAEIVRWSDGQHKYKGYIFWPIQPRENLEALQTFEVRDEDVYLVTYPKSGTHWIYEIVHLILENGDAKKVNRELMVTTLEHTFAISPEKIKESTPGYKIFEKLPSPRLIMTHIPEPLCPPQWFIKKAKIIYFARNPKDLMVSYHKFMAPMMDPKFCSWNACLEYLLGDNDTVFYGSWFDHVLRYWQHKDKETFFFVKYEDCHKDLKGIVTKIAKFIGKDLSDNVIEGITQQCTFKEMKKTYGKIEEDYPENGKLITHHQGKVPYLRNGVVGDWKEQFSPEQNEYFNRIYEEKMAGSGLTIDFEL